MNLGDRDIAEVRRQQWFAEIERLRAKLHRMIDAAGGNLQDERVLEIASELDQAINGYMLGTPVPDRAAQ